LSDPEFRLALGRSIEWTLGNALLQSILGLSAGLLLQRAIFARGIMRVWILLPWIVPTIAIAILWRWILDGTYGILNYILVNIGVTSTGIAFLGSIHTALMTSIFINSWRWFPFLAIIVLAGLLSIPSEELEAAKMDGAGFWHEMRFITMPYLTPTLVILGLIGTLWSFNMFDILWLMTKGGPGSATRTLPVLVYEQGFRTQFQGRASTIGVIMMLILLVVLMLYFHVNRRSVALFAPGEGEET
jgi:multiple sugar transport system permease protein